ncbi:hypothetical protein K456DRAFT_57995 [Colletotrichum gloeosporioides 23]|nr:hypothetical protein K456DRAFT_57995 [Colletotrichum gloeosporioides 23]
MKGRVFDAIDILKIHPGCPFATEKAILRVLGANHFLLANARGSARRDLCDRLAGTKSVLGRLVGLNGAIRYRFRGGLQSANDGRQCGLLCPCAGVGITAGITLSVSLVVG